MRVLLVTLVLLGAGLAGCVSDAPADDVAVANTEPTLADKARVIVADIDTGINPYHLEFRDTSPEAYAHPSTYLAGYPADALALNLTFEANDYVSAVQADCEVWNSVRPGVTYWIPGTRIIAARTLYDAPEKPASCEVSESTSDLPGLVLDRQGHGTMTASRVAGATYSLCPDCKMVALQGFSAEQMLWSAEQPWIDLQTNSWGALPDSWASNPEERDTVISAIGHGQAIFVAGGNGAGGFFGVSGHPAYGDNIAGSNGIIMVGGHDGGRYTPWTMTMPHVVADASYHPAAHYDSLDGGDARTGGGTSGATPFAAGTYARVLLEARRMANDTGTGMRNGDIAVLAANGTTLPSTALWEDGLLTTDELKMAFFHTADPRPQRDAEWDGEDCDATSGDPVCILYPTTPVEWGTIPREVPAYYFVGYGQVGARTLEAHLGVVIGDDVAPDRSDEDGFYQLDAQARFTVDSLQ